MKYKYEVWDYPIIKKVEIERETGKTVFINGHRKSKRSDFYNYFDTKEEVAIYLRDIVNNKFSEIEEFKKSAIEYKLAVDKVLGELSEQ